MGMDESNISDPMGRTRYYLLFDGDCGYCRLFKSVVKLLDFRRLLVPVELGTATSQNLLRNLEPALFFRSFHLVDDAGRTVSGGEAVPSLVSLLFGSRALSHFLFTRRVKNLLVGSYALVSRITSGSRCAVNQASGTSFPRPQFSQ